MKWPKYVLVASAVPIALAAALPLFISLDDYRSRIAEEASARLNKADFGPFDARVKLDGKGKPEDASVTTRDSKLKAVIKPDQANYLIDVSASALPAGPPLLLDESA